MRYSFLLNYPFNRSALHHKWPVVFVIGVCDSFWWVLCLNGFHFNCTYWFDPHLLVRKTVSLILLFIKKKCTINLCQQFFLCRATHSMERNSINFQIVFQSICIILNLLSFQIETLEYKKNYIMSSSKEGGGWI